MRRLFGVLAVTVVALFVPSSAEATTTTERFPFDFVLTGAEACGEDIHISGTLLAVFTATDNGAGGFVVSYHFNPQGITGVGLSSGVIYQATGVTREVTTVAAGTTDTYVNNFKIIGHGDTPNFLETDVFHITVNASGEITAVHDSSTVVCR